MESVGGVDKANRIGILPPEVISQYSGLEVLKRMVNGELPLPAMSEIIPFRLTEAASGRVVFESTPDERFYNTAGNVHGGYAMTLLDTCMLYCSLQHAGARDSLRDD
jgi:acyl-coenzyme A thioesterase PaaI-like protein